MITTREQWLNEAVELLRPIFRPKKEVPEVLVSIGFPPHGGLAKRQVLGVCCTSGSSADKKPQIYINPVIADIDGAEGILSVLTHELVHACGISGHGKEFRELGVFIGLDGKMASSTANKSLQRYFVHIVDKLGKMPHAPLDTGTSPIKPDKCRMNKCACPKCGYTVRIASKWIVRGIPRCPICDVEFETEQK